MLENQALSNWPFFTWLLEPFALWYSHALPNHDVPNYLAWHARVMVLAWGILAPVGAVTARYWKIWPGQQWPKQTDHKGWWHTHRFCQWVAAILTLVGVYLIVNTTGSLTTLGGRVSQYGQSAGAQFHFWVGIILVLASSAQVLSALLRGSKGGPTEPQLRGDHFDMTLHRRRFEAFHKTLGWLAIIGAIAVIIVGLNMLQAPRWMWLALSLWWTTLIVLSLHWQRKGQCIDTYQTIWGADPNLPGLAFKPTGWGVRRIFLSKETKA
jgi:hypothetical protein